MDARFLVDVAAETGWSSEEVERFMCSVIATLEERMTRSDRHDLEAQLPSRLCQRLRAKKIGPPHRDMTYDEFLGRVGVRTRKPDPDEVEIVVRLVFRALRARLSTGEAHHVEAQLPDELRRLWNPAPFGRR
jgi:uncharacterized protein (DUF2267 family)